MNFFSVQEGEVTDSDRNLYNTNFKPGMFDAFKLSAEGQMPFVGEESLAFRAVQNLSWALRDEKKITAKDANEKYGIDGFLSFDSDVPESVAFERNYYANRRKQRQQTIDAADSAIASFAGGVVGSFTDPINMAFMVVAPEVAVLKKIPIVGSLLKSGESALAARSAVMAGKASFVKGAEVGALEAAGIRLGVGAAYGAAGGMALEPAIGALDVNEGREYDLSTAIERIGMSTAFGGAFHLGTGEVSEIASNILNANERKKISAINDILEKENKPIIQDEALLASKEAIDIMAYNERKMTPKEIGDFIKSNENYGELISQKSSNEDFINTRKQIEKEVSIDLVSKLKENLTSQPEQFEFKFDKLSDIDTNNPIESTKQAAQRAEAEYGKARTKADGETELYISDEVSRINEDIKNLDSVKSVIKQIPECVLGYLNS